jgi:hypothetical protein
MHPLVVRRAGPRLTSRLFDWASIFFRRLLEFDDGLSYWHHLPLPITLGYVAACDSG